MQKRTNNTYFESLEFEFKGKLQLQTKKKFLKIVNMGNLCILELRAYNVSIPLEILSFYMIFTIGNL